MTELRKTVDIKTIDEDERTATGAVLVPNELDHQHDFLRPDAVQNFHSDDPDTGVMHAAFPDDAATLERNEVIDESETIGDEEFAAGTWVATRRYEDGDLWQLVADGVLQGFSIGGEISRAADHEQLPADVRVPDDVEHESGGTELIAGVVNEVSDVDIPAVPRARYKSDLGKSILEDVDDEAEFVELMIEQRGHDEADARRLYQYLTDARSKTTRRDILQKPIVLPNGAEFDDFDECVDELSEDMSEAEAEAICGAGREQSKCDTMSDSNTTTDEPDDATKWQILKELFLGSDDAAAAEAQDQKASDGDGMDGDDEDDEDDDDVDNDSKTATMTDDDTASDEPPEWAKSLTETVEQIDDRVDKLEADGDADAEKTADEAPEWAQDLAEKVEDLDERVDTISKQSGHSQQLDESATAGGESGGEVERFKAGLVGGRTGGD